MNNTQRWVFVIAASGIGATVLRIFLEPPVYWLACVGWGLLLGSFMPLIDRWLDGD